MNCYLRITTGLFDKLTTNFSLPGREGREVEGGNVLKGGELNLGEGVGWGGGDSTRRKEGGGIPGLPWSI